MRDGYRTELFNSRGVHRFSAGDDEKKLAEKYEQYAQAVEEYRRLATTLRELADKYRRDAARMAEGDLD
jgi:aldehyde:ferredoxin oxidoreductase